MISFSQIEQLLFTERWMDRFIKIWNSGENALLWQDFSDANRAWFAITQDSEMIRSTQLQWGAGGKLTGYTVSVNNNRSDTPLFTAPYYVWEAVIYSYYTPIQAIVNKKMEFRGYLRYANYFNQHFATIADIAIQVNQQLILESE